MFRKVEEILVRPLLNSSVVLELAARPQAVRLAVAHAGDDLSLDLSASAGGELSGGKETN